MTHFADPSPGIASLLVCCLLFGVLICQVGCGSSGGKPAAPDGIEVVKLASGASYDLSVPRNLTPGKKLPLFFFLSPDGNPRAFTDRLKAFCHERDVILAGSYDYKNDIPHTAFLAKVVDCLTDLKKRLPVDEQKMFIGGFSGGAQASYVTCYFAPGHFTGILANSGVLHENLTSRFELEKMKVKKVAIISGKTDDVVPAEHLFDDRDQLKSAGIKVDLQSHDGGHELAPAENLQKAMAWLLNP